MLWEQFFLVVYKANRLAVTPLSEVLDLFSGVAAIYRKKRGKVPVLIIDNANKLPAQDLGLLQDYAKLYSDEGTIRVAFVTSGGSVPRHMMGNPINLFINCLFTN